MPSYLLRLNTAPAGHEIEHTVHDVECIRTVGDFALFFGDVGLVYGVRSDVLLSIERVDDEDQDADVPPAEPPADLSDVKAQIRAARWAMGSVTRDNLKQSIGEDASKSQPGGIIFGFDPGVPAETRLAFLRAVDRGQRPSYIAMDSSAASPRW
jgi:hypothetical protein